MTTPGRRTGPTLRRLAPAALLVVGVVGGLGACSGANNFSVGSVNGCFRSLPAATAALRGASAHLLGVHLVPADRLPAKVKAELPAEDDTEVCAVAFKGTFAAGKVSGARTTDSGDYAVVLVDEHHLRVIGSYVGDHLPKGLQGHLII